jgi:hypothetical protein
MDGIDFSDLAALPNDTWLVVQRFHVDEWRDVFIVEAWRLRRWPRLFRNPRWKTRAFVLTAVDLPAPVPEEALRAPRAAAGPH